ncbi:hypothetical protein BDV29DRAFT_179028 [Aspergillus leporis]|uniref:Uncharacterized protein n=1 Tax=Aspergillus leporis TaxID=41062 RepID=A0A5N5WWQ6_9EURO|nr:hypothetical protein BDV29DRAFT_179028 [Aspergillus leporis]
MLRSMNELEDPKKGIHKNHIPAFIVRCPPQAPLPPPTRPLLPVPSSPGIHLLKQPFTEKCARPSGSEYNR